VIEAARDLAEMRVLSPQRDDVRIRQVDRVGAAALRDGLGVRGQLVIGGREERVPKRLNVFIVFVTPGNPIRSRKNGK